MSSQHTTFESSHKTAEATKAESVVSAERVHQTSIDAVNSVVGLNPQSSNATYVTTVAAANITKLESLASAEKAKQASLAAARETLKNAGTAESAGPF